MRNHTTHIGAIPHVFYVGGENHGQTSLKHPTKLTNVPGHYLDNFEKWVAEMESLTARMRK
jgi:hypothetical protein